MQEWEGVVKIPFIEERRLVREYEKIVTKLTPEEVSPYPHPIPTSPAPVFPSHVQQVTLRTTSLVLPDDFVVSGGNKNEAFQLLHRTSEVKHNIYAKTTNLKS